MIYIDLNIKLFLIISFGGIIMIKIINKLTNMIRDDSELLYRPEYRYVKRERWGAWVSSERNND